MKGDGDGRVADRALVQVTDVDFCVVTASRDELVNLQLDAEARGFATRWSSVEALLRAVGPSPIYLRPLLRERRNGLLRSYRCLALFSLPGPGGGGVATFDVAPERFGGMASLALDAQSSVAFSRLFDLSLGGITHLSKE